MPWIHDRFLAKRFDKAFRFDHDYFSDCIWYDCEGNKRDCHENLTDMLQDAFDECRDEVYGYLIEEYGPADYEELDAITLPGLKLSLEDFFAKK